MNAERLQSHQPWSSSSADAGFSGATADSALTTGSQSSMPSYPQFHPQPYISPYAVPSIRAAAPVSRFMAQSDGTRENGFGGAQQSMSDARNGVPATAQISGRMLSPSQQSPSTWATAQAHRQDAHQFMQHVDGQTEPQNGVQQNRSGAYHPALNVSINNRQNSPQRSVPEAIQGSRDPMTSTRHETTNPAAGMPAGSSEFLQQTDNSRNHFTSHTSVSHTAPLNGLSQEPHHDSMYTQSRLAPAMTHDTSERSVQQPGVMETGALNTFARFNVSSPQANGSPSPFNPWHDSWILNSSRPQQQNGGDSWGDST